MVSKKDQAKKNSSDHKRKSDDLASGHKKIAKSDDAVDVSGKNINNVIGGYKATLHNEHASEEAKEHSRRMIEQLGGEAPADENPAEHIHNTRHHGEHSSSHESALREVTLLGKNLGNVIGGYKATLHNEHSSKEAKEHARKMIEELAPGYDDMEDKESFHGKDVGHVIAGYKATLHNAHSSEEAKEHARKMIKELGGEISEEKSEEKFHSPRPASHSSGPHHLSDYGSLQGRNLGHVIGGYKATLHNEHSSEEAKQNARKMLDELAPGYDDMEDKESLHGKDLGHVIGGYKATLHNAYSSEEAKDHARKMIKELGGEMSEEKSELNSHVIGGYKAALHNPNVSEEAKERAEQILEKMGVNPEEKAGSSHSSSHAAHKAVN